MTAPSTTAVPPADDDKTSAGNYFVSNYPPYYYWRPDFVPEAHAALDRPPRPNAELGIYLHIPYCRKRCHFCYFKVYTGAKSSEIREYIDAAVAELEIYRTKSFIGDRKPAFIYFGGGTPSFLSTSQLTTLAKALQSVFPWDAAREITFECEPGTLNQKKLQFIRSLGVTRLSLGVENFDEHILEINGRAHRTKEIDRAYDYARQADFPQINIDLIAGMLEETPEKWAKTVEKTVAMAPDSVTIYQMEIPFNTTIYKRMRDAGRLHAPVADWHTKREWVAHAFDRLEAAGYTVTSAYTAVRDPQRTQFVYRDELWRGADLMSLGVASFSHVNGTHYQNAHDMDTYLEHIKCGRLPISRALTPTTEELMIRELILQFKLGRIELDYFRSKFDTDVMDRFSLQLNQLEERGLIQRVPDALVLSREGLLSVDALMWDFFLPKHQGGRYA